MLTAMDVAVAGRIKQRRIALGMSQAELAERLNVDELDIVIFECEGLITAGMLWEAAQALDTSVEWFFSDAYRN